MVFAQQAMCSASLQSYLDDRQLHAYREGSSVVINQGSGEYVCQCVSATQPPVCKPRSSSGASGAAGAAGAGGLDLSRFSPGQQVALTAAQSLLQGLFEGLFSNAFSNSNSADSERAAQEAKARQDLLVQQDADRRLALQRWNAFKVQEKQRLEAEREAARSSGQDLLARMGATGGQGMTIQPLPGEGKGLAFTDWEAQKPNATPLPSGKYSGPTTALEQARCAAYFSERSSGLSGQGKREEAEFMSQQAQKAMTGEPLDVACQPAAPKEAPDPQKTAARNAAVNEVLALYNAKIKELLDLSEKLAAVRKQKVEAETRLKDADTKIADIKQQAAAATTPQDQQKYDALLAEALALKSESENQLKTATENENDCLASARQAESQVKELSSKLQEGPEKK
jgi:hypothetical protein